MQMKDTADLGALGLAIKEAREKQHISRKAVAKQVGISERHLMAIENDGQHPSVQVLYTLVRMFGVPLEPYFFPDNTADKSALQSNIEMKLKRCDQAGLAIVDATLDAVLKAHQKRE